MSDDELTPDEFDLYEDQAMTPLLNLSMKKEEKPPILNEKSNLVQKPAINAQETPPHAKEVTDIFGKSGWWQIKILILTGIISITTSWNHLGMAFLAYPVDHWCAKPVDLNISLETWRTEFLPNATVKGKLHYNQCEMFAINMTTETPIKTRTIPCSSYEYDPGFDSIVNKWNLVCDMDWTISTSQMVYMFGFLFSVLIYGQLADMYGRHPAIMISLVFLIVAGFIGAFSTTYTMFTICRFFIAIGHGGVGLVSYILLIETVGSEYRVLYMVIQGFGWHIGFMILPLIAWLDPNWFRLQLYMTAPSIIFLSYFWLLPESPRWLLARGNIEKAIPILENAAKCNGKVVKDLENQAKIVANLSYEGKSSSKITVIDLLRTPNLRMKTICLYFIWAVIAFTYYGLSLNTNDLEGNDYFNFFLSGFIEVPATIFCIFTLNRFGRKKPFFFTLMLSGLACFGCIFVPMRFPGVQTALAMTGKMFNSACFSIVYIFSAEIFPTVARNVGVGSCSTVARIGSAVAPYMKDLGSMTNPSVPLVLFGVLSIISALIVLKMPETNNQPVPESIDQAEQFGKKIEPSNANGVACAVEPSQSS